MSKAKAEAITPESVDDMTDEQLTEFMEGMQEEGTTEEQPEKAEVEVKTEENQDAEDLAAKADDDNDNEPAKAETVDFKRFDYERNRRKEAEKAKAAAEAEWARRFDELLKAQKGPEKQEPEGQQVPDWDEDPFTRMQTVEQRLEEFMSSVKGQTDEQKQAQERRQQEEWALAAADQTFAQVAEREPDLRSAMDFALDAVKKELVANGYYGPAFQQEFRNQVVAYASNAPQEPAKFAEYVRRNARYWGWSGQQQEQQQTQPPAAQQQTQDVSEAARKAKTLSNGGGSPGISDSITPEQLLNMSEKEFDAYIAKHGSVAAAFG